MGEESRMTTDFKPYPHYKDSGLPWLEKIPEHWEIKRGKAILNRIDLRSDSGNEELLTVSANRGVIPRRSATVTMFKAESYAGYKLCWPGDLVINSLWAWASGLGVSKYHGIVSSAYGVYRVKSESEINPNYLHFLVKSTPFQWELQVRSKGVWTSRLQLTDESFLNAPYLIPPLAEQNAIVRYLDYMDRRIKRYIIAKKKLIKLLTEQKQAIIHQAVTRGLDPNVRLKPSGVEWLGDIPEHWECLPLKRWVSTKITDGPHETPELFDDGIPFMSAESIANGFFDFNHKRGYINIKTHQYFCKKCHPQKYDIFMCKSGATTGKVAMVETDQEFSVWSPLALIRVNPNRTSPRLMLLILQSYYIQKQVENSWSFGTQQNLSMTSMERIKVALPHIEEQISLLSEIENIINPINDLVKHIKNEIELIIEFRTRLIADVVTGMLDVREAAAQLPDRTEAFELEEPLDDKEITEAEVEEVLEEEEV